MRKVISSMMITLDGFFEGPNGEIDWHVVDEEFQEYSYDLLCSVDAILFGRVTYQLMAGYWSTPLATKADPIIADKMNILPKIVFSRTLPSVDWSNTRFIKENMVEEIIKLKQQPGKDLVILGSGSIVSTLMRMGLVDQFRIIVNPVILGKGKSLFNDINGIYHLKLLESKTLRSGNVVLYYHPEKREIENETGNTL